STVSTLLNMSDGLLSDGLGIKFICTFNENIPAIDEALLRKGRLVSKYEFKPLCVEKTTSLLNELYPGEVFIVKELTLADIYNIKDESYINEHKKII
ncbi:MAG: ATPase, partial [Alphaproteobacteria bacterium]|nr:ATPase [Alphaproteobacteria bacterium]